MVPEGVSIQHIARPPPKMTSNSECRRPTDIANSRVRSCLQIVEGAGKGVWVRTLRQRSDRQAATWEEITRDHCALLSKTQLGTQWRGQRRQSHRAAMQTL